MFYAVVWYSSPKTIPHRNDSQQRADLTAAEATSVVQSQMFGYCRLVGSCGIHPFARPAWHDQSSALSAFHVHCIQPFPPFSYAITCASHILRKNVLYSSLNVAAEPVMPSQLPTYVEFGYVPS